MAIKNLLKRIYKKNLSNFQIEEPLSDSDKRRLESLERYKSASISFYGKAFKVVDSATFLSSYYEIFLNEIYKFTTNEENITIIDCGANVGLATIYFKMNFPMAKIIAYEPDPHIYKVLVENIRAFNFDDVMCLNEAVSDIDGKMSFQVEGGHSGMLTQNSNAENTVLVRTTRLNTIITKYKKITFLKIDIEGHENIVIADIAQELKKVDFLFLEYHSFIDRQQELTEILNSIRDAGMRYYIKEAYDKKNPFLNREIFLNMDMLVNIFCYRN